MRGKIYNIQVRREYQLFLRIDYKYYLTGSLSNLMKIQVSFRRILGRLSTKSLASSKVTGIPVNSSTRGLVLTSHDSP